VARAQVGAFCVCHYAECRPHGAAGVGTAPARLLSGRMAQCLRQPHSRSLCRSLLPQSASGPGIGRGRTAVLTTHPAGRACRGDRRNAGGGRRAPREIRASRPALVRCAHGLAGRSGGASAVHLVPSRERGAVCLPCRGLTAAGNDRVRSDDVRPVHRRGRVLRRGARVSIRAFDACTGMDADAATGVAAPAIERTGAAVAALSGGWPAHLHDVASLAYGAVRRFDASQ